MKSSQSYAFRRNLKQLVMTTVLIAVVVLGWLNPLLGYFVPACMVLGLGIGAARGRQWCDWYCPRGSFFDAVMGKIKPHASVPFFFKRMSVRLTVMAVLMTVMTVNLVRLWFDPYRIGLLFVGLLTATTALGILLAFFFHPRAWCQLCPVGTISNLMGRGRRMLMIDSIKCIECKRCAEACPMGLRPYLYRATGIEPMTDADCIKCGMCAAVCPTKALSFAGADGRGTN